MFTTLGIQFWDFALDKPIEGGLEVVARRPGTSYPPTTAFRTGSGFYGFQGLPGLHDVEYPPPGPNSAASSPPLTLNFVITANDPLGRFLPTLFGVDLPLPYRGLFLSKGTGSPADIDARAYLFSAPTRPVAVGMAAVRANLRDVAHDQPARYAAVRVTLDGQTWTGIADDEGRALVTFPSPLVRRLSLGSPPGSGQGSPSGMTWPVSVHVLYEPSRFRLLLADTPDVEWPWAEIPSLKSILDGQHPALIWQTEAGPPVAEWTGVLTYGEDLVLRTTLTNPAELSPVLLISQTATSP
ncbi:MAG: hypothetical protein LAN64_15050 [Acidobacteriia bacterium]|nr:hypothetical protein [Terriglobia bacterium]